MSHTVRMKSSFTRGRPEQPTAGRGAVASRPLLTELEARDVPATFIWDGEAGAPGNWSVGQNWTSADAPDNTAPNPAGGDVLIFPTTGTIKTTTNDFNNGKFVSVSTNDAYTFNGNSFELTGAGTVFTVDNTLGTTQVNVPSVLFSGAAPSIRTNQSGSDLLFSTNTNVQIGAAAGSLTLDSQSGTLNGLQVSGSITGPGNLIKTGNGIAILSPTSPNSFNTYTGATLVQAGELRLSGGGFGGQTIPGNVEIGDDNPTTAVASLVQTTSNQINDNSVFTIRGDGLYNIASQTERIGSLVMGSTSGGGQVTGTFGVFGTVELTGNITVGGNAPSASTIATDLTLLNPTTRFNVARSAANAAGPDLRITGSITAASIVTLVIDGGGRTQFESTNSGGYATAVNDGVLILTNVFGFTSTGSVPGPLTIGDDVGLPGSAEVQLRSTNGIGDASIVSINSDGLLSAVGQFGRDTIGGLSATSSSAQVQLGLFDLILAPATDLTYSGAITGDGRVIVDTPNGFTTTGVQTLAGPISLTGVYQGQFSVQVTGGALLQVTGPVTGNGGGISSLFFGGEELYLSSSVSQLQIGFGDFFYPGTIATPGPATTGDLDLDGTLVVRITDPAVFGSLAVTGSVGTSFNTFFGGLRVELPGTYRPSLGESFKIIDITDPSIRLNASSSFFSQFSGKPEGSRFTDTTGTVEFQITYAGGDGNDVVITNTGAPSVTVRRAGDQPMVTSATTVAFTARFSGPVQPILPDGVNIITTGSVTFDSFQTIQQNDQTFRIVVLGVAGTGTIRATLDQGAAFSLAGTPSQPSVSIGDENLVIVNAAPGVGTIDPPPGGSAGGLGFFSGVPGPRTLVGAGVGGGGAVNVYQGSSTPSGSFQLSDPAFVGGVRVASADFNRDGVEDYLLGSGPGAAAVVVVLDGRTGQTLFSVAPFEESFTGGVYVAAGDVNNDGIADVVVTPDQGGGPRVQIYSGAGFVKIADFFGIDDPTFRGGARAAVGDINGDGFGDIVVAAGFGGGPRVASFDGKSLAMFGQFVPVFADFFAYEPTLRNGTFVQVADTNGDALGDLIVGAGPGGGPRVTVFDGRALARPVSTLVTIGNFFAGPDAERNGVPLGLSDFDGDGVTDLITGTGFGGGSRVRAYPLSVLSQAAPPTVADFDAFPGFANGVFVG